MWRLITQAWWNKKFYTAEFKGLGSVKFMRVDSNGDLHIVVEGDDTFKAKQNLSEVDNENN